MIVGTFGVVRHVVGPKNSIPKASKRAVDAPSALVFRPTSPIGLSETVMVVSTRTNRFYIN